MSPDLPEVAISQSDENSVLLHNQSRTIRIGKQLEDMLAESVKPLIRENLTSRNLAKWNVQLKGTLRQLVDQERIYLHDNLWGTPGDHWLRSARSWWGAPWGEHQ